MDKINNWIWEDKQVTESTNDDALTFSKHCQNNQNFVISAQQQV